MDEEVAFRAASDGPTPHEGILALQRREDVNDEQQDLLDATISEWKTPCNISSRIGWENGETRKTHLQDLAYDTVLEEIRLGSQHAILATHQAAAALDGVEAIQDHIANTPRRVGTRPDATGTVAGCALPFGVR